MTQLAAHLLVARRRVVQVSDITEQTHLLRLGVYVPFKVGCNCNDNGNIAFVRSISIYKHMYIQ